MKYDVLRVQRRKVTWTHRVFQTEVVSTWLQCVTVPHLAVNVMINITITAADVVRSLSLSRTSAARLLRCVLS